MLVLERREVEPVPRAGTVLPRPLELFDARGIAEQFIHRTSEVNPNPYQTFHIWAGMAPVSWSARDSRFGFTLMLAQHETEAVLRRWAQDCGAELRFRHEMIEVHDSGDAVTVVVRDQDGATSSVRARYVVGADGGRSRTREQVGIDVEGHADTFTGVIATAKMQFPWPGTTRTERNEHGWVAANPFGLGLTRFTMVHAEGRAIARTEPVTIPGSSTRACARFSASRSTSPNSSAPADTATRCGWRLASVRVGCSWWGRRRASTTRRAASA